MVWDLNNLNFKFWLEIFLQVAIIKKHVLRQFEEIFMEALLNFLKKLKINKG